MTEFENRMMDKICFYCCKVLQDDKPCKIKCSESYDLLDDIKEEIKKALLEVEFEGSLTQNNSINNIKEIFREMGIE